METVSLSYCVVCWFYFIPEPITPHCPPPCMHILTPLHKHSFWAHTPPAQCPGPGSSHNNSGAAPPAATRWKLPLGLSSFSELCVCLYMNECVCACVWMSRGRVRIGGCVLVCVCQPYPSLHPITLHSRSILLHPATNMYVTSPSILSLLCQFGNNINSIC